MKKMIVLFYHTCLEDEDEAKSLCKEMIDQIQRRRDAQGVAKEVFTIQGVVIDA